jgi:hypothetical protein
VGDARPDRLALGLPQVKGFLDGVYSAKVSVSSLDEKIMRVPRWLLSRRDGCGVRGTVPI